jgi:hypothetical protein
VCVCPFVYPPTVARQRLGKNVTAVTNTHATIEELLDASFCMRPVSYQGKEAISSFQNFLFVNHLKGKKTGQIVEGGVGFQAVPT